MTTLSCGRGCLSGFEIFKTSFSLKNVVARLDSTRSVSLCQAIHKNLKKCDRPTRSPFCRFVVSDNYETFILQFALTRQYCFKI